MKAQWIGPDPVGHSDRLIKDRSNPGFQKTLARPTEESDRT